MKNDFWARASAYLKGKGLGARDISELQTMDTDTTVAPTLVVTQPTNDATTPPWAQSLMTSFDSVRNQVTAVAAWQKAFDEMCEKEKEKEAKDSAAKDQAAKDADEMRKKQEADEKTGDVLISAEDGPGVYSLGKIWNGLTGDQAIQEVVSLSEAMVPGAPKITRDSVAGTAGVALASHMRSVLTQRATTDADSVSPFIMDGTPIAKLNGARLAGVFMGLGKLSKIKNNVTTRTIAAPARDQKTTDAKPADAVRSYITNMSKYAEEKAKVGSQLG